MTGSEQETPPTWKQSRAKLWIRTGILVVFGTLFGLALYRDITSGGFRWSWGLMVFLPSLAVGFWMRRWVPMHVHLSSRCITLSFDRIYFSLIFFLVLGKAVAGRVQFMALWSDIIMCVILGLMMGRLSGICLRVHSLKKRHHLID
jgi:heme/copper-type cytochrome/quinol oxidase subunit 4